MGSSCVAFDDTGDTFLAQALEERSSAFVFFSVVLCFPPWLEIIEFFIPSATVALPPQQGG